MTAPGRRFPPPWKVEEYRGIAYIVRDANTFPWRMSILKMNLGGVRQRTL
jgi:hypothetical protein